MGEGANLDKYLYIYICDICFFTCMKYFSASIWWCFCHNVVCRSNFAESLLDQSLAFRPLSNVDSESLMKSCGANLDSDCRRSRTCRGGQLRDFINEMWKEQWRSLTVVATKWYRKPEWNKTGCTDRQGLSNKGYHPPVNNGDSYPRIPLTGIRKKENQTLQFELPFQYEKQLPYVWTVWFQ